MFISRVNTNIIKLFQTVDRKMFANLLGSSRKSKATAINTFGTTVFGT
jgi:hypothetical protein